MANYRKMMMVLEERCRDAEANNDDQHEIDVFSSGIEADKTPASTTKRKKGLAHKLVKSADEKLLQGEQLGLFSAIPASDTKSIPTLLARLPIFLPVPSRKQTEMLDKDLAFPFETPFGRGRRFGPPVTIEDEDVLFALIRLSERRLIGHGSRLPVPLHENNQWLCDSKGHVTVQVAIATVGQINTEMGLTSAGKNYKNTLAACKRLNHVALEIETRKKDLYLGESWNGETIRLVDIKWKAYDEEGLIYAQFQPVMIKWLKEQATYFNWGIRRRIKSANGRALHRFLSTQGQHYKAPLNYIADAIGWHGSRQRIRPRMEDTLTRLKNEFEWCDYEITGSGRATPFVLEFWRQKT